MSINFKSTSELRYGAELTFANMQGYYETYSVDWDADAILEATKDLTNFDIISDDQRVGTLRLSFDNGVCQLRDLQVEGSFQNKGIGAAAVQYAKSIAMKKGLKGVELKVFKISPAYRLYVREGFKVSSQDDRFYYMSLLVT